MNTMNANPLTVAETANPLTVAETANPLTVAETANPLTVAETAEKILVSFAFDYEIKEKQYGFSPNISAQTTDYQHFNEAIEKMTNAFLHSPDTISAFPNCVFVHYFIEKSMISLSYWRDAQ